MRSPSPNGEGSLSGALGLVSQGLESARPAQAGSSTAQLQYYTVGTVDFVETYLSMYLEIYILFATIYTVDVLLIDTSQIVSTGGHAGSPSKARVVKPAVKTKSAASASRHKVLKPKTGAHSSSKPRS